MAYQSTFSPKLIYVFRINDERHEGCLKIGEATADDCSLLDLSTPNSPALNKAARKRIKQYTQTAGIDFELLHTELAAFTMNKKYCVFRDSDVHNVLKRSGIQKKDFNGVDADEWFVTDLQTAKNAIDAVKNGRESLNPDQISTDKSPIKFRPEQKNAIELTVKRFAKSSQMLWNAKMRFGKTLCALEVVKRMDFVRTLILTHRPVVNDGWFDDFNKIFKNRDDFFEYGSKEKGNSFGLLERNAKKGEGKYVYFASMQDLRGSEKVGGNFDKNNELFKAEWDCIIVDEAHEGTKTELGQAVLNALIKDGTKVLQLSGTPFNLMDDYKENEIYTWDYVMEQRAKAEWDITHPGDPNPYSVLPKLNIYTFNLGKLIKNYSDNDLAFNFHEFFRVNENGDFVHDKDVDSFLNLICKKDDNSNYPYSTEEFRNNFRHSLWMVPGVDAAKALSAKMKNHKVFGNFTVVNVAGNGDEDEENDDALKMVRKAIGKDPEESYTITLSCGRLTTGVSVPEWTAVFMLSGSANTAAAGYMQTIFRVQTPAEINGKIKTDCFVFDFAPDRTLKVIAETAKISAKAGKTSQTDRKIMGEFLNFCPIIGYDGTKMASFDVEKMLGQLKRVQVERVVRNGFEDVSLYNEELLKLDKNALEAFNNLKKIIGTTKAMAKSSDVNINDSGFTDEEYDAAEGAEKKKRSKKDLSPEDLEALEKRKEARKQRDAAVSILRGISIRMPLLIYGADLVDEDEQITIDNFENLVDDTSWKEFMPAGVTKELFRSFKKYYEEDIFREAGKRIREMTRAADSLTIEERINRIGHIFNSFRNPDKETVLTPWRVVNMHIGESLGGYVFFDENYDNDRMLENPRFVDRGMETKKAFDVNGKILEINSKSGLYPLYMAYTIYRNELKRQFGKMTATTISVQQKLWDKVVAENIFVVCKTPMAVSITKRTLMGFRKGLVNTKAFENLEIVIAEKPETFVGMVKQGRSFWGVKEDDDMKFNAVVGNPPYQIMGGSGGSNDAPIYQHFVSLAKRIAPESTSFIIPARWYAAGRKSLLGNFRKEMISNGNIVKLYTFLNSRDVFPTVDIKGGCCFFLQKKDYVGPCAYTLKSDEGCFTRNINLDDLDVIVRDPRLTPIVLNVWRKMQADNVLGIDTIVSNDTPFGIPTKPKDSKKNNFNLYEKSTAEHDVELYYIENQTRKTAYVCADDIEKNSQDVDCIKVFLVEASGSGTDPMVLGMPILAPRKSVCSQSYLYVKFADKCLAVNFMTYLYSKFFRILVSALKITQHASSSVYRFVPLQDFTSRSDIDWSKSVTTIDPVAKKKYGFDINEIDAQLYAKYRLSGEEIAFIETHVKEMK